MNKVLIQDLIASGKVAHKKVGALSDAEKTKLEKSWDVEHAYYSSTLEGSKLDRKDFEGLAKEV